VWIGMPILIVSDPKTGASSRVEIQEDQLRTLVGTRIGDPMSTAAPKPG